MITLHRSLFAVGVGSIFLWTGVASAHHKQGHQYHQGHQQSHQGHQYQHGHQYQQGYQFKQEKQGEKRIAAVLAYLRWKKGEALAQNGYGLRFTDYPPRRENGGNCYACHQISKQEVSYGTIGPSLLRYGKLRNFAPAEVKATYEKIYNSHAVLPCSNMPRFGANKVLTIEQIKDAVALLMSPDSPVNKD